MKNLSKKTKSFIVMTLIAIILVFILVFIFIISNQKWELDGNIVKKGNKKYEIGDYYEYDETIDNRLADVIDVKWKVLGVDDAERLASNKIIGGGKPATLNKLGAEASPVNEESEEDKVRKLFGM